MDTVTQFKPVLGLLLQQAMNNARKANDAAFASQDENKRYSYEAAVGYASLSYADFRSLWTITKTNADLDRLEFDNLMQQAKTFCTEYLDNLNTNHSQQWTDIEYIQLAKKAYDVQLLLDVEALNDEELNRL